MEDRHIYDETKPLVRMSVSVGELAKALAEAQKSFGAVRKTRVAKVQAKSGASYEYAYADLSDVLDAIREPLAKQGLAIAQPIFERDGHSYVVTYLLHGSGEWMESLYPLAIYERPQDTGSALTYARRYALTSLLGIAAEDDDGQQASTNQPQQQARSGSGKAQTPSRHPAEQGTPASDAPSREQLLLELSNLQKQHNIDAENILRTLRMRYSKQSVEELEDADLADLVGRVRKSVEGAAK